MARLLRVSPVDIPQHIIQRGNNRQICFSSEQDFMAYANWLQDYAIKFKVDIHAWVLMTNHIHILCTPRMDNGISGLMQGLGRQYVRYFNSLYNRTGSLWEGRYKSCIIEEESYLLEFYRYIELNPVRAGMVDDPSKYRWSSYGSNALGKQPSFCSPHPLYMALADDRSEREIAYQTLFKTSIDGQLIETIRTGVNKGMAIGSDQFKQEIEVLTGRRMTEKKRGRPTGWRKKKL